MNSYFDYNLEEFKQWLLIAYTHLEEPRIPLETIYNRIEGNAFATPEDIFVTYVEELGYTVEYDDNNTAYNLTIKDED